MGLLELANYLHLPMAEAARQLKVCSTALKHVCRRNGLARWPSRQVISLSELFNFTYGIYFFSFNLLMIFSPSLSYIMTHVISEKQVDRFWFN